VASYGLKISLSIVLIRRLGLGFLEYALGPGAVAVMFVALLVTSFQSRPADVTLAFASGAPAWLSAATERILADGTNVLPRCSEKRA
jgi:hypothetical protein